MPVGTSVTLDNGLLVADLSQSGQSVVIARYGDGCGVVGLSNTLGRGGDGGSRSAPGGINGLSGDRGHFCFELKSIADIGLVGFPNAGKSSLLRRLSRAQPKVANYPFTTLRPHLGVMEFPDYSTLKVADIPGLIEGAHENKGMGFNFLRHVERTDVFLFVLDVQGFQLSPQSPYRSAAESFDLLLRELDLYQQNVIVSKPTVVAVNKMDTDGAMEKFHGFNQELPAVLEKHGVDLPTEPIPISVANTEGLDTLRNVLRDVTRAQQSGTAQESFEEALFAPDEQSVAFFRQQIKSR